MFDTSIADYVTNVRSTELTVHSFIKYDIRIPLNDSAWTEILCIAGSLTFDTSTSRLLVDN